MQPATSTSPPTRLVTSRNGARADVRICFFGDSLTAGVGDPTGRGWIGPLTAGARAAGVELTAYNLGVRRDTGDDIASRWLLEARPRLTGGDRSGVVFSYGTNDVDLVDGRRRVDRQRSLTVLDRLLVDADSAGWPALVVGPPPVADRPATARAADLASGMAAVCAARGVPFLDLTTALAEDPTWAAEVAAGDAFHPSTGGYARLAAAVQPAFDRWLSALCLPTGDPPRAKPATTGRGARPIQGRQPSPHVAVLPEHLVDAAVALWHQSGLTRPWNDPHTDLRRALHGATSTILAALDTTETLLGTAMVGHDGHRGWIYYLAVTPTHQRTGLGRALMRASEQWLRERAIPKVNLMVRHSNHPILAFYQALDYTDGEVTVLGRFL